MINGGKNKRSLENLVDLESRRLEKTAIVALITTKKNEREIWEKVSKIAGTTINEIFGEHNVMVRAEGDNPSFVGDILSEVLKTGGVREEETEYLACIGTSEMSKEAVIKRIRSNGGVLKCASLL